MLTTVLSVLSYLGFDAITTLAEESNNPKRDIPKAIFLSVLIGGSTMILTGYLAMLVIPNWRVFANDQNWVNTTLFYVSQISGGRWFALFYTAGFVLAMAVLVIVATAAAARLLFGMGRDEVLPQNIFGAIHPRWKTPHWNIIIITALEFLIGIIFTIDNITELVSYGALLGFILLNLSVVWLYFIKDKPLTTVNYISRIKYFVTPMIGVLVTFWVFLGMQSITFIVGSSWLILGIVYGFIRSKGYKKIPPSFGYTKSVEPLL